MTAGKKILVVEDEMIVAQSMCKGLQRLNYTVLGPIGAVDEAVQVANEEHPDLILMDINLNEERDGIFIAEEVNKKFSIPVVYVTGMVDPATIERVRKTEPYGYLTKPFSDVELRLAVEMAIQRHEKQLKISESSFFFAETMNTIDYAIVRTDVDMSVTYVNPVAERLFKSTVDQLVDEDLSSLFVQADENGSRSVTRICQELQKTKDKRFLPEGSRIEAKDGGLVLVGGSISAIASERKQVLGFLLVFREVTGDWKEDEQVRIRRGFENVANEIRNRLIKERTPDIGAILELMGKSVSAQKAFMCLCHNTSRNGIGQKEIVTWVDEAYEDASAGFHAGMYLCSDWWKDRIRDGEPLFIADLETLPDEANPEKRSFMDTGARSIAALPFFNENAGLGGFIVIVWAYDNELGMGLERDALSVIAELVSSHIVRQKVEEMLRGSEKRFRSLIQKSSDIITVVNAAGEFVFVSPSVHKIMGYQEDELLGKKAFEYVHPEDLEYARKSVDKIRSESVDEITLECRFLHKDGSWVYLESIGTNLVLDPLLGGVVFNSRNISYRKQYEQELIEARDEAKAISRIKTTLLANMSHEMRTPLTGILGFANLLEGELKEEEMQEMARRIHVSGRRLLETIESILDLAKLEADKVQLQPDRVDLVEVILRTMELHTRSARHKGLLLEMRGDIKELYVEIDRQFFGRILHNLLSNAIKYTEKGEVTVTLSISEKEEGKWVVMDVKDTGVGISNEFLPKVFDEFRQESSGFSRKFEGSGLGLTISRKLLDIMGGEIKVNSIKGKGAVFSVYLPYAESAVKPEPELPEEEPVEEIEVEASGINRRILVVEDDFDSAVVARLYLKDAFEVETVDSGEKALERIRQGRYDLILLDISLGAGMDGVAVLGKIRELPGYETVPVIALTAHALHGDSEYYISEGFTDYLAKPYKKKDLMAKLSKNLKD